MCSMEKVNTSKKKAGRPQKNVKREVRINVRFTKTEYFIIREKAAKAGINATEYIRKSALYTTVHTRLTEEERKMLRELIGMSNNINQIAKICHQQNVLQALYYLELIRGDLDAILKKLKND
jgi:Bacterial mobilisation protein (MobC).